MTNGTAAGTLLCDLILGRESPWSDVYRPTRRPVGAALPALLEHGGVTAKHILNDKIGSDSPADEAVLFRDDAAVVSVDGDPVGVYRDDDGTVHAVSAVCTHQGCHVTWNDAERTWDCPCHGSRFDYDGRVIDTPAVEDLPPESDLPAREFRD
jgi:Rieske Fe-S protein